MFIAKFSLVTQSCPTLCDPMDCSTPGLPVHHQLLEFTQTHVHWVGDAIQPSHSLSSPSPPAFNFSSIRVFSNESVLPIRWLKYWSFSFSISPSYGYLFHLGWTEWISLQSKGLSRVFSNTTVQKHQFIAKPVMKYIILIDSDVCMHISTVLSPVQLCNPMDCNPPGSYVHGDSLDKNIGVGCHALLQGIFPTQRSNMDLLHCRWFFTIWATREAPVCMCECECVCVCVCVCV